VSEPPVVVPVVAVTAVGGVTVLMTEVGELPVVQVKVTESPELILEALAFSVHVTAGVATVTVTGRLQVRLPPGPLTFNL
jgi:hypothetical protein